MVPWVAVWVLIGYSVAVTVVALARPIRLVATAACACASFAHGACARLCGRGRRASPRLGATLLASDADPAADAASCA